MKTILGVIFVVVFAALTGLSLAHPGGADGTFVGLVGLALTVVVVWRERFPNGLSYVLIALGMLRAVFPVVECVRYNVGGLYTAYVPWACESPRRLETGLTAVQAIVLIGVGAWWLWWAKGRGRSPSGLASMGGQKSRRGGLLMSTPASERAMSKEEARLADAGARKLFNKPLSALISDFEKVGAEIPVSFFEMLVAVGKRASGLSAS